MPRSSLTCPPEPARRAVNGECRAPDGAANGSIRTRAALRFGALLVSVAALAACASTSAIVTGKPRTAITADQVRLYTHPPRQYEEIALIQSSSRGSFTFSDQAQMDVLVQRLKEEAAKLGANGVLLESTGNVASGSIGTGVGTGGGGGGGFTFGGIGLSTTTTAKAGSARAIFVQQE
ncbi:MAG: hypothetical protein QM766_26575 [Burkholderiaceae bacterium]